MDLIREVAVEVEARFLGEADAVRSFAEICAALRSMKSPALGTLKLSTGTDKYDRHTLQRPPPQLTPMPV
jgi:hypothetical protein